MKRWWTTIAPTALVLATLAACDDEAATGAPVNDPVRTIGGARPATLMLPNDYEAGTRIPLVIVLHGYTSNARWTDGYFGMSQRIEPDQIAVILPNGTRNTRNLPFWNGTDYCCGLFGSGVDDVAYLNGPLQRRLHVLPHGVRIDARPPGDRGRRRRHLLRPRKVRGRPAGFGPAHPRHRGQHHPLRGRQKG